MKGGIDMMKSELEELTMRSGEELPWMAFEAAERHYMSDNVYHERNNAHGIDETKQEFARRVFGGKVNTLRTFALKLVQEAIRENEYCLRGCRVHEDKAEMNRMSRLIAEQTAWECCGGHTEYSVQKYVMARIK
jgi:hypothetical protein